MESRESAVDKNKRGRPLGSARRFRISDPDIPEFVGYSVIMDLLRQLLNWCPRYDDWRELVESGAFPSYPHPSGWKVQNVRVRLYKWPEVEAYYRSILQPITAREGNKHLEAPPVMHSVCNKPRMKKMTGLK